MTCFRRGSAGERVATPSSGSTKMRRRSRGRSRIAAGRRTAGPGGVKEIAHLEPEGIGHAAPPEGEVDEGRRGRPARGQDERQEQFVHGEDSQDEADRGGCQERDDRARRKRSGDVPSVRREGPDGEGERVGPLVGESLQVRLAIRVRSRPRRGARDGGT